jgi:ABC-2 type transport system ATP-binding protein
VTTGVEATGLSVVRGGTEVLHDLTFAVEPGVVTGLLGPSGCGKSTLLRAIVGVQRISAGTVTVFGEPAGSASLRSRIGYVTQAPSVYDDLTIEENLAFFADVLGARPDRVDVCVRLVDLHGARSKIVGRLSGGERSRVSLAVALLGEPALIVLDEPTVGLDPVLRRDLWGTFHSLAANAAAVFVSSHVMDEATRCDRLMLMRDGRIIADDTPQGLLEKTGAADIEHAFLDLVEEREP